MRGITRWFGPLRALDGVDLALLPGEIHGLLGENGAGKSTLMNVLAGTVRPDAGTVTVGGRRLPPGSTRHSTASGIGMVHQHFSLIPALTVAENLALAAVSSPAFFRRTAGLARPAFELAENLGWRLDPRTPVWQLPVGHQQRLEIVKALQRNARWLLLDEPTAVLSPPEIEELFAVLVRLREEGRGIVFITHKLREVRRLCDRITVLRRGRRVGETGREATAEELASLMVGAAGAEDTPRSDAGGAERIAPHQSVSPSARSAAEQTDRPTASHPGPSALVVRDLWARDGRGSAAVRGLSFEVQPGEIFGVAGVDGNGQTELAEAILGLRPASAGSVTLHSGIDHPRPGYVPPDRRRTGLILPMSVRENLALEIVSSPEHRRGPFIRLGRLWATTREMARRFDVRAADERQPAGSLSGGNQQKIVLARALSGHRRLLVAVNPTRGLDFGATGYVHAQLKAVRDTGMAILLISTELDELLQLSDRIGVLYEGRLQGIVAPTESRERLGQMMGGTVGPAES